MAQLIIDIPSGVTLRVLNAICTRHGYTGDNNNSDKAAFVKQIIIKFIKGEVAEHEAKIAASVAYNSSHDDVQNNINIT
jgi:hypothetical protein